MPEARFRIFRAARRSRKKYISHFDGIDGLFTADVTAAALMKMLQKKGIKITEKTEGGRLRRPGFYPLFDYRS